MIVKASKVTELKFRESHQEESHIKFKSRNSFPGADESGFHGSDSRQGGESVSCKKSRFPEGEEKARGGGKRGRKLISVF